MAKIVAFMKAYDVVDHKVNQVLDTASEELVSALFYSFGKYKQEAIKELPVAEGAQIQGPSNFKEMIQNLKNEMADLAQKMGESLVNGMAKSLAENMPLYRMVKTTPQAQDDQLPETFLGMVTKRTVFEMLSGIRKQRGELDLIEEEVPEQQLSEEIRVIEIELEKINTQSHFAQDIKLYERFLWQTQSLRKRIWLFIFHLGNFFWNAVEAERSRTHDETIVKLVLWAAGAIFSAFELKKSQSFSNILSFYCYTPERFGLTILKINFIALFAFQFLFFHSCHDRSYASCLDKTLEKIIISIGASTAITIFALAMLKRGYLKKIESRKSDLAQHKEKLHALLNQKMMLIKKA